MRLRLTTPRPESLLAWAAAAVGIIGVVSALTPEYADRFRIVHGVLPPGIPTAARVGALAFGIALVWLARSLARPVAIVNDADAAGIAEMRFGVGKGQPGVVIFLTLGTGVGSGTFLDGKLLPNTEFGQMEIRGRAAERRSASAARVRKGLSWKAWTLDLDEHLNAIDALMWPDLMILGGGVSKNADRFLPRLTVRCPVVPAQLRNDAGIVGAAIVAAERGWTPSTPEDRPTA